MSEEHSTIIRLWYEMYPPHVHEAVSGYEDGGKQIVMFRNRLSGQISHAYLKGEKLMPFFPSPPSKP